MSILRGKDGCKFKMTAFGFSLVLTVCYAQVGDEDFRNQIASEIEAAYGKEVKDTTSRFLEPLSGVESDAKRDARIKLVPLDSEICMVVHPSFDPQYSVSVCKRRRAKAEGGKPNEIWIIVYQELKGEESRENVHPNVTTLASELPVHVATVIRAAWLHALAKTSYAREEHSGLDGTVYEFNADRYWGSVWSPRSGLPLDMVKLGNMLIDIGSGKVDGTELLYEEMVDLARGIMHEE